MGVDGRPLDIERAFIDDQHRVGVVIVGHDLGTGLDVHDTTFALNRNGGFAWLITRDNPGD